MTNSLLPIIEQLANAHSQAERANWLKRCPMTILSKYNMTIRNRLKIAGFPEACDYLDAVLVVRQAVRDERGLFGPYTREHLENAGHLLELQAMAHDQAKAQGPQAHDAP